MPHARRAISMDEFESETHEDDVLVAFLNGRIAGYIALYKPEWFVHHLYIDPKAQGAGIGTTLLTHTAELAMPNPLSLKCLLENKKALAFYRSFGFAETDESGSDEHGHWIKLVLSRLRVSAKLIKS